MDSTKQCRLCGEDKALADMKKNGKSGYLCVCKACHNRVVRDKTAAKAREAGLPKIEHRPREMKQCPICKGSFLAIRYVKGEPGREQKYCSRPCFLAVKQSRKIECQNCGNLIDPNRRKAKYCSQECVREARWQRMGVFVSVKPDPEGFKTCLRCLALKPESEFTPRNRDKTKTNNQCKDCIRKAKYANYTEQAERYRLLTICRKYGLSLDEYRALTGAQGGRCAICGKQPERPPGLVRQRGAIHRLNVDHDHRTGRVRGLLCHQCNAGVGNFNEDPALLHAAIAYIERTAS